MPGNMQRMESPRWSDVQIAWEPDGALRDVYVHGTTEAEWQGSDEIEFDLAPTEIVGQTELDIVVGFVHLIGRAIGKPATVCNENWPDEPFMAYDPTTDGVTVFRVSL